MVVVSNEAYDGLTNEERLKSYAEILIASAVGHGESVVENRRFLFGHAKTELFRDEVYLIYKVLYNFKDRNISIDSTFMRLFLEQNLSWIDEASSIQKIDVHAYGEVDDSPILGYLAGVVKFYNTLLNDEKVPNDEYQLYFEKYLLVFSEIETSKVYANSLQILGDGMKIGRKILQGYAASRDYVKSALARIDGVIEVNQGVGFISMEEVILTPRAEAKSRKIADFGAIRELNDHYGGVYTGNIYTPMAPSKSGKSKFCARIGHTAMVHFGTNVSVWAFEGGYEAWTAQMRSIHFDYTYNSGVPAKDIKQGVTQGTILQDSWPAESSLKDLERTSALDLVSNPSYGRMHYIDRPFKVETFLDEIDTSIKANNSSLLIIDYLQLIGSEKNKSKQERIAEAYPLLLDYCKKNNIACMSPAQYKQTVVDMLQNRKDGEATDMRTAGGESYEIVKTSDVIFSLWASAEDIQNNKMVILTMPTRFYEPIPEFEIYIDLGYSQFISLSE